MYQIEVKRYLVEYLFPPSDGWEVAVDIDPMERGIFGQQPRGKREIAERSEAYLLRQGVQIGAHPIYKRADVVATHPIKGTHVIEAEGRSARQPEQKMYSALGQLLLAMNSFGDDIVYGIAVPNSPRWEEQLRKIPPVVCRRLGLRLLLVSSQRVRALEMGDDY